MKKACSLFLSFALLLLFSACSGGQDSAITSSSAVATTSTPSSYSTPPASQSLSPQELAEKYDPNGLLPGSNQRGLRFTFQSELVGWVTGMWRSPQPYLYETFDGGQSWRAATIGTLPQMMLDAEEPDGTWPVMQRTDGHWSFSLLTKKYNGYIANAFYEFILDEETGRWVWDDPEWPLPPGVDEIYFIDYVTSQTIFHPRNYNAQDGLDDDNLFSIYKMIYDAAFYNPLFYHTYSTANNKLPFEDINAFAAYAYGDTDFDIRSFLPQLEEWLSWNEDEITLHGDGPMAYTEGLEAFITEVALPGDGTIEVYTLMVYWGGGGNSGKDDPVYRRSIYQPCEYLGFPIFTLLNCEQLDFSLYQGEVPLSHWA